MESDSVPISELSKVLPEKQAKGNLKTKAYEVEGNRINVSWKEFTPNPPKSKEKEPIAEAPQDEAIIFLPGWSAGTAKTLEHLAQSFADEGGRNSLSVTTRTERIISNSLFKEAQAIRDMIVEKGLKKITLAAHSEGGSKAVNLIHLLQEENQNVEIEGLILLDPVGLYEQGKGELTSKFGLDILINTPMTLTKNLLKNPSLALKGLQASSDIVFNVAREIASSKVIGYPQKLWSQIGEMAKANTHYTDVKCPIVLIQGEQDPVSDHKRVIPTTEEAESPYERLIPRREILKKTFFPNSPQVDMLVPEKIGHHGLPHFRADSVSNASLGLLNRYWRKQAGSCFHSNSTSASLIHAPYLSI